MDGSFPETLHVLVVWIGGVNFLGLGTKQSSSRANPPSWLALMAGFLGGEGPAERLWQQPSGLPEACGFRDGGRGWGGGEMDSRDMDREWGGAFFESTPLLWKAKILKGHLRASFLPYQPLSKGGHQGGHHECARTLDLGVPEFAKVGCQKVSNPLLMILRFQAQRKPFFVSEPHWQEQQ